MASLTSELSAASSERTSLAQEKVDWLAERSALLLRLSDLEALTDDSHRRVLDGTTSPPPLPNFHAVFET